MIDKKQFKTTVAQVIKNNGGNCSVYNQNMDTGIMSSANMRNVMVSWGRDLFCLYIPSESAFIIPYTEIKEYTVSPLKKQIDVELNGRNLFSIRGIK